MRSGGFLDEALTERRSFMRAAWSLLILSLTTRGAFSQSTCPTRGDKPSVAGKILHAASGAPLENASIVVEWDDLTLNHGTLKTSHHEASTAADRTGQFNMCGLPIESPLTLQISAPGFRDIRTDFALPADGVLRHTFRLAEEKISTGAGAIRAKVVDDTGRAMTTGKATIASLGRRVNVDSGMISFGGLPGGTWVVEVRAIGYERAVVLLDAGEPGPAKTIRMDRAITMLDPVSVVEKSMGPDRKTLNDIALRMRTAGGTLILASDLSLRNATRPSDPLPSARGFFLRKNGYEARPFSLKGALRPCQAVERVSPGDKAIAIYLDGVRMPMGLQAVNSLIPPADILAIEAYPEVASAPFLRRTNDACAVVAFWTKKR
jgi:hypothetical protein